MFSKPEGILAYIAGIIDGEGCIYVRKVKPGKRYKYIQHSICIAVNNTDKKMIDFLQNNFPAYVRGYKNNNSVHRRKVWVWSIQNKKAEEVLKCILPYLITKKEQAELAIQISETKKYTGVRAKIMLKTFLEAIKLREILSEKIRCLKYV